MNKIIILVILLVVIYLFWNSNEKFITDEIECDDYNKHKNECLANGCNYMTNGRCIEKK